jgi:hypothetical protein
MMNHLLWFLGGIVIGVSLATYAWNKHFYSRLWNAREKVTLAQLQAQERKAARESAHYDNEIDKMYERRVGQ